MAALELKKKCGRFIAQSKGWRANSQLMLKFSNKSRAGRFERLLGSQALHRVYVQGARFDQAFPFEQYIPVGEQNVPPLRGWKSELSIGSFMFFEGYRMKLRKGNDDTDQQICAQILPEFWNPFVQVREKDATFAEKILRQLHTRREKEIVWPAPGERIALLYIDQKPADMTETAWIEQFKPGH